MKFSSHVQQVTSKESRSIYQTNLIHHAISFTDDEIENPVECTSNELTVERSNEDPSHICNKINPSTPHLSHLGHPIVYFDEDETEKKKLYISKNDFSCNLINPIDSLIEDGIESVANSPSINHFKSDIFRQTRRDANTEPGITLVTVSEDENDSIKTTKKYAGMKVSHPKEPSKSVIDETLNKSNIPQKHRNLTSFTEQRKNTTIDDNRIKFDVDALSRYKGKRLTNMQHPSKFSDESLREEIFSTTGRDVDLDLTYSELQLWEGNESESRTRFMGNSIKNKRLRKKMYVNVNADADIKFPTPMIPLWRIHSQRKEEERLKLPTVERDAGLMFPGTDLMSVSMSYSDSDSIQENCNLNDHAILPTVSQKEIHPEIYSGDEPEINSNTDSEDEFTCIPLTDEMITHVTTKDIECVADENITGIRSLNRWCFAAARNRRKCKQTR